MLAAVGLLASCAAPPLWTDLTSVSVGKSNEGGMRSPARVPDEGRGWVAPAQWRARGFRYGTRELVEAVTRAAERVHALDRRAVLGVADLSAPRGGPSPWHNSHHSGRDVDLLFYTADARGRPMPPPEAGMIRFDADLEPVEIEGGYPDPDWKRRRFDVQRNWHLLEALLTDPTARVQWVFVAEPLRDAMLQWAEEHQRPRWIIEYARAVVHQPGDSRPHDDHFHIRLYCTRDDRRLGCVDRGVVWQHEKKTFKYGGPERYDPVMWRVLLGTPGSLL